MERIIRICLWCVGMLCPYLLAAQPTANFTSDIISGCSPIVVRFTDMSSGSPTSWSWDLGNGTTSTLQNPSTTYITPGTYTVKLTAANASGSNMKSVTSYITVYALPTVNFTGDSAPSCPPKAVQFNNLTVPGSSGTTTYLWDFGDGFTSSAVNPSHTYMALGTYSVTLIAKNGQGCTKSFTKTNYIPIVQKPIANFISSNNNGCAAPYTVNFTNTSAGAVSYEWNFGDGGTSTTANPGHVYTTNGNYNVRLIATNAAGCKDTIIRTAFVSVGTLDAQFTPSQSTVCLGTPVTFSNNTTPGTTSNSWNFGNSATSNATSPTYTYPAPGNYTVRLIANRNGCLDTAFRNITVNAKPTASFTAANTYSCSTPFSVPFTNNSTGASSYAWAFGPAGATSTQTSPSYTYTGFGLYTVRLIATGSNGCADTQTRPNYITVAQPTATITTTMSSGCAPVNVNFYANIFTYNPVVSYSWNFGDGSSPLVCGSCSTPSHTYTSPGTYTVTLNYSLGLGCNFSAQRNVVISTKPTASFNLTPLTYCPNTPVSPVNVSTGATSYIWNGGGGQASTMTNPTFGYKSGNYTIRLIASNNGCADTFTRNITVQLPRAGFRPSYTCTNRLAISFTDQSAGANTYFWDFGDGNTSTTAGNTSHTYAAYGTYNVKQGVRNTSTGCTDTAYLTLVLAPLNKEFVASDTTICRGSAVTFTAAGLNYQTYRWDFGNSVIVNGTRQLSYTYPAAGTYNIKLVVTDTMGCKDSLTKTGYMRIGGPTVDFVGTPQGGCLPLTVNFQDLSTPNGGFALVSRNWNLGNGNSTQTNPTRTYTVVGLYNVSLFVTDANGCTSSLTRNQYINASHPQPAFSASVTTTCIGNTVTFNNTSSGNSLTYVWHYGDGATSVGATGSHAYGAPGQYTVKLVATDAFGCKDSVVRTNYITIKAPVLSFTASDTFASCPPLLITFTNTSPAASGVTYTWNFGNGSGSSVAAPSATYTYPGVYAAKLYGTTIEGCIDSAVKNITINGPSGSFAYTPQVGCGPLTVTFTANTTNASSLIWDMNNGSTQTTTAGSLVYTYTQSGKFLPKLILSDNASCLTPLLGMDTIRVDSLNSGFTFTPTTLCDTGTVYFTDTVYNSLTPVISRSWNFGDGGTSTAHNPTHKYTSPGTYIIRLVMTNTSCTDTTTDTIVVHPLPNVTATGGQTVCQGSTASISLQATGALNYSWAPATGLSCTGCANPTLTPPSVTTTYVVTGTNTLGCTDTARVLITVNPKPVISAGNNVAICVGGFTTLQGTGGVSYNWSPAAGLSCTSCASPIATPTATTTYKVIGTNANGCSDSAFVTVTVNPLPVINAGTAQTICLGNTVQLQASGAATYTWSPTAGLSCIACANPTASPVTTTTYTVTGVSIAGCVGSSQVTVNVNPLPNVSAGPGVSMCQGFPVSLQATGATSYVWTPAAGLSCTACANPTANPATTATYTVTGTDANGCKQNANVTVTVNPVPVIVVRGRDTICAGDTAQLLASGASTYVWSPATGLSCTVCPSPVASPATSTTYKVIGTANGCSDSATISIFTFPKPSVTAGPDKNICIGNFANIEAKGAKTYTWTPATGLACTNCASNTATPTSTTTYTVIGTDSLGCIDSARVRVTVHATPDVDAGEDKILCEGSTVTLNVTGAKDYTWTPGSNLSCTDCDKPDADPKSTITYKVRGVDVFGCSDSDEVVVNVINKQPTTFGKNDTLCRGESTALFATGGSSYEWAPAAGLSSASSSTPTATPDRTTEYSVIIKQGDCFTDTGRVTIVVYEPPFVDAGPDISTSAGSEIKLNARGGADIVSYQWSPATGLSCTDCASPTATPKKNEKYVVTVANALGCTASDEVNINVSCDASQLFVANTFTPNADGVNDWFYPQGKGIDVVTRFSVYNRWGQLIFDAQNIPVNDPLAGWDGTYKFERLKPDVFVYILRASCASGQPLELKGDVSLIR